MCCIGSCLGSCFAGLCCGACGQCTAVRSGPISRLPYVLLFLACGVFSIVMALYGEEALELPFTDSYTTLCQTDSCLGVGSVYRTSFVLFLFALIHVVIIGAGAVSFHWLCFAVKLLVFIVALILAFVIETPTTDDFFRGYADYFARFVSALYLILQILILIVWSYDSMDWLRRKADEHNAASRSPDADEDAPVNACRNPWYWLILLLTVGLYVTAFTFLGVFYVWFAPESGSCGLSIGLITTTMILCLLTAVLSVVRADGSFLVSATVSIYAVFLLFAGLQSAGDAECNVLHAEGNSSLWVGCVITLLSIVYAAMRADRIGLLTYDEHKEQVRNESVVDEDALPTEVSPESANLVDSDEEENDGDEAKKEKKKEDEEEEEDVPSKEALRTSHTFFHGILCLAACYYAMLFTNWATSDRLETQGNAALWVNMVSQWICIALFWWTLLAPVVCPSRFGHDDDDSD